MKMYIGVDVKINGIGRTTVEKMIVVSKDADVPLLESLWQHVFVKKPGSTALTLWASNEQPDYVGFSFNSIEDFITYL